MVSGSNPSGKRGRFFHKGAAVRLMMLSFAVMLLFLLTALLSTQWVFAQSDAPRTQQGAVLSNQNPAISLTTTDTTTPTDTSTPGVTVTPTTPPPSPTPTHTPTPTPTTALPTATPTFTPTSTDTPTPTETFTPTTTPAPSGNNNNGGGGGGGGGGNNSGGGGPFSLLLILLLLLGVVVLGGGGFALYYYTSNRPQQAPGRAGAASVGRSGTGLWGGAVGAVGRLWNNAEDEDDEYYDDEDDEYYDDEYDEYEEDEWDGDEEMWEESGEYYDPRTRRSGGPMTGAGPATGTGWGNPNTGRGGVARPPTQPRQQYPQDDNPWPQSGGTGYQRPPQPPKSRPNQY